MTRHPSAVAIALAFAAAITLPACDGSARLTEQEHIQRAKDFEDTGNLRGSIIELKNAIQKNPDSPQARLLLGQVYLKGGYGAEAEKELTQAEQLGVSRQAIKPQLGEALLLMGEYKRVLDEIYPDENTSKTNLSRILQVRGSALLKQGKLTEACNLFQQSLDADPANPPTYWGLAQCAIAKRDMAKAKEWLDAALKLKEKQARTWLYVGDLEQLNKNPQGALTAYSKALSIEPENLDALQSRAIASMKAGQFEAAGKDISAIGKLAPNSVRANYLKASLSYSQKKFTEANEALQEVFKTTPDHAPSLLLAGMTAYALGSYQQAESHFRRFLVSVPGHRQALKMLASTQIRSKQPDKALETLAPFLRPGVDDAPAFALAGEAHLIMGDPAKATEYFERSLAIEPDNAATRTQLGLSHLAAGNTLSALNELAEAAHGPNQHGADALLVMTHLNRKEYDKALAAINGLEKGRQNSAAILSMRGQAYLGKNDLPNARKSFEQALAIDPLFYPAIARLAQLDLRDNKPEAARKRFEGILDKDKNNLNAMMALAELAALQNQEKDYFDWLEKAAKANPTAIPPRAALVRYHLAKNAPQKALAVANEAVTANPDNPAALNLLGSVQLAANDKISATSTFTRLSQKADQSPDAFLNLARAQIAEKKLSAARTSLQHALKLKPDHLQSQDTLIKLELEENRLDAALQIARQIQAQHPQSPVGFLREGDILLIQKRPAQAVQAYEQAITKGAGSSGLIQLHRAHTLAGNTQLADRRLADWIRQHPSDGMVRAYAAEYHAANGRYREAIAEYQAILRQAPENILILNNLANLYLREGDKRALPTAEQAHKLAPGNPVIEDTLGWILVEQGQTARGLDLLRKALAQTPKNPSLRYHYAAALARTGDKAQARKILQQLLAEAPGFEEQDAARRLLNSL